MSSKLRGRLSQLERRQPNGLKDPSNERWLLDDWLDYFEQTGKDGTYKSESDFPAMLSEFRAALVEAKLSDLSPTQPPAAFMAADNPRTRLSYWQNQNLWQWPRLDHAWKWLAAIGIRVGTGKPPLSKSEWYELASWYRANWERLRPLVPASLCLSWTIRHGWPGDDTLDDAAAFLRSIRQAERDAADEPATVTA